MDCPMRGVRAVIFCLIAALVLSGCLRRGAPVAAVQPQSDLDARAYGQSYGMTPAPSAVAYATAAMSAVSPGDTVLAGERWF
jgi:polysaccharide export outer membrane protein